MVIEIIGTKRRSLFEEATETAEEINKEFEAEFKREQLKQKIRKRKAKGGTFKEKPSSSLTDLILYAGNFTKRGIRGSALTLLDSETRKYVVLAREIGTIATAVPVDREIFGRLL